ncbi:hypothetical protein BG61_34340 [Caballeronia glathei]|uniref:Uncharacterized protein n=1 Tax=Caballeronia glathei TaxID=60547 RepID=A0A069PF56_9BURK|nr:hypothetical protein BG61_34340 [Caballeronia glathei]
MTNSTTNLAAELPIPEAGELVSRAIQMGVSMQIYIGYHVLRSAYGPLHPVVVQFEAAHFGR